MVILGQITEPLDTVLPCQRPGGCDHHIWKNDKRRSQAHYLDTASTGKTASHGLSHLFAQTISLPWTTRMIFINR